MARKSKAQKELEAKIEAENKIRYERRDFLRAIDNYYEDIRATARYYKINEMNDKLGYSGGLIDEEAEKIFNRFNEFKDVLKFKYDKDDPERRNWDIIHWMRNSNRDDMLDDRQNERFSVDFLEDDLYINDIIWDEDEVDNLLKLMKRFGYKRIFFLSNSSGVMENIYFFLKKGCMIKSEVAIIGERYFFSSKKNEEEIKKMGVIVELPE